MINYSISPYSPKKTLRAARPAVSVRRIRLPRVIHTQSIPSRRLISSGEMPPSGPMTIPREDREGFSFANASGPPKAQSSQGTATPAALAEISGQRGQGDRSANFRDAAATGLLPGLPGNSLPPLLLAGALLFIEADDAAGEDDGNNPGDTQLHRFLHNPVHFVALGKPLEERNGKGRLRGGKRREGTERDAVSGKGLQGRKKTLSVPENLHFVARPEAQDLAGMTRVLRVQHKKLPVRLSRIGVKTMHQLFLLQRNAVHSPRCSVFRIS